MNTQLLAVSGKRLLAGGLLAAALTFGGAIAAGAQLPVAAAHVPGAHTTHAGNTERHMIRVDERQVIAQKLGISTKQLHQDLKGGMTLAQEAQAHNVSRDDLKATIRGALKTDLDKEVVAKTITQAKEDKALARFDLNADKLLDHVAGQHTK